VTRAMSDGPAGSDSDGTRNSAEVATGAGKESADEIGSIKFGSVEIGSSSRARVS
jgi:hypothetical protein